MIRVVELRDEDRPWAEELLARGWGSVRVVSRGRLHRADRLPGLVALRDEVRAGLLTYRIEGEECEIVTIQSIPLRRGIGSALIQAVREVAIVRFCRRLWLVTTNDNTPAIEFYHKLGFRLVEIHRDAIEEARRQKPELPRFGHGGAPIRDELEFESDLPGKPA